MVESSLVGNGVILPNRFEFGRQSGRAKKIDGDGEKNLVIDAHHHHPSHLAMRCTSDTSHDCRRLRSYRDFPPQPECIAIIPLNRQFGCSAVCATAKWCIYVHCSAW